MKISRKPINANIVDYDWNYEDIPEDVSRITDPDGYINKIAGSAVEGYESLEEYKADNHYGLDKNDGWAPNDYEVEDEFNLAIQRPKRFRKYDAFVKDLKYLAEDTILDDIDFRSTAIDMISSELMNRNLAVKYVDRFIRENPIEDVTIASSQELVTWDDADMNYTAIPEDVSHLVDPDGYLDEITASVISKAAELGYSLKELVSRYKDETGEDPIGDVDNVNDSARKRFRSWCADLVGEPVYSSFILKAPKSNTRKGYQYDMYIDNQGMLTSTTDNIKLFQDEASANDYLDGMPSNIGDENFSRSSFQVIEASIGPVDWDDNDLNYTNIPADVSHITDPDGYLDEIAAGSYVSSSSVGRRVSNESRTREGTVIKEDVASRDHYGNHCIWVDWDDGTTSKTMSFWVRWLKDDSGEPLYATTEGIVNDEILGSVDWSYYDKFQDDEKYLPRSGEGETKASQLVTALTKLIYKWYNDGDVFDNNYHLEGWANDLSSYANWIYKYYRKSRPILDRIYEIKSNDEYEVLLKDLADLFFNDAFLAKENESPKEGSIYSEVGEFSYSEQPDECDECGYEVNDCRCTYGDDDQYGSCSNCGVDIDYCMCDED
jgi:hypothetical protein